MLSSGQLYAQEFSALFHPFGAEYDLERRHPEAVQTLVNLTGYVAYVDELREALQPDLDLISSKIITPVQELEAMLKNVSKAITKRDHKLIDFDRHNNSYVKLKEKSNRSAKDDQAMFKLETDCETSAADYEHHNNLLKTELPQFFALATRMMTPIFYSFYYMQLNIFYATMDRLQKYAQGKYDLSENNLIAHEHKYSLELQSVVAKMDAMSIRKPVPPSARILQMSKAGQKLSTMPPMQASLGYPTGSDAGFSAVSPKVAQTTATPTTTTTVTSTTVQTSSPEVAAPPAYTAAPPAAPPAAATATGSASGGNYVVALYDYTATVRCHLLTAGRWRSFFQDWRPY
ncbi:BAR adaptor protein Hob1 [Malassezia yamatoensis]|uniref:BAR adaptor protein Hob1 n=1 Tax=Malassezia yamatoensis TaxID=253288 RepID=A0AAJ5YRW7_9BASI|nr:BAR adaptor protein Hob1 [Malassezia yamatoensis]